MNNEGKLSDGHFCDESTENKDSDVLKDQASFLPVPVADLAMEGIAAKVKDGAQFKSLSLDKRLSVDVAFRQRFLHTLCLLWAFVGLGWMVGQMGPSFPDLTQIIQKDIETASWLFTIFSIGYLIGSLVTGILYDRCNKLLLIAVASLLMGICTGFIPWCKWFPLMLAMRFIAGLGAGGLDTGGNADLLSIWDEEGRPFMQAAHFCFGFGGIISPLVSEPFLAKKQCLQISDISDTNYTTSPPTVVYMTQVAMTSNASEALNTTACQESYGETSIHYSYLISLFIISSGAIPFLVMYLKTVCNKVSHTIIDKSHMNRPDKLRIDLKVMLLVLLYLFMMMYCAVEDTFAGLLATFCLDYLKWDKQASSFATSAHWAAFSVGRFSGIFLINLLKPVQLLFIYCLFLISAFFGILILSLTHTDYLMWVFVPLAGFSMSIMFPCIFTWTDESILKVSGMVSSGFLIAGSTGLMLNPLFISTMMSKFSAIAFSYILFAESCLCLVIFLVTYAIVKKCVKHNSNTFELVIRPECEPLKSETVSEPNCTFS